LGLNIVKDTLIFAIWAEDSVYARTDGINCNKIMGEKAISEP